MKTSSLLRAGPAALVPLAVQAAVIGSVGLGLLFLLLPGVGYLPALGRRSIDLAPLQAALLYPGLRAAAATTLLSGLLSTMVALLLAIGLIAVLDPLGRGDRKGGRWLRRRLRLSRGRISPARRTIPCPLRCSRQGRCPTRRSAP